ncbi:glycoside hydrolase family 28 protein [Baudoinia panamericana UAMH 10762]|uniref:Glycoside hydrolase family 28 protein n=1 Tax=Baudoinia panamericana (strain UAMH 10762) TaxID=717646 RepID=M2N517_BAUPA|nr:glycoside hydrolase family 28 protein [Baudoinia panamericana UAMH 10762]EMC94119.1 glycoside hydrolase family 28 protein [Baudoinia panamericana UAMH 10762]
MLLASLWLALWALPALVASQSADIITSVGPKTSIAAKRAIRTCNITSYGAVADGKTDISTALKAAFNACKSGGVVVIPNGNYALANWVTLSGGNAWALQLDGIIYRNGTAGGNMIFIEHGGLDGIDVWSTNIWIHDIMVTNKDEYVTVKSPARNILVEQIYCNWSGGCAMGSLGSDTNISAVTYKDVYTWSSNQMYMIKSNGGNGTVSDVVLENFIGHGNAYSLNIDQYWSSESTVAGNGVQLSSIKINNWTGTEANGAQRGPVRVICADGAPCTGVDIKDFAMWTETGNGQWYACRSAYTDSPSFCLKDSSDHVSYSATTSTATVAPTGYQAPKMSADLATLTWGTTAIIPIPAIPTSFFLGTSPLKPLAD